MNQNTNQPKMTFNEVFAVLGVSTLWLIMANGPGDFLNGLSVSPLKTLAHLLGGLLVICGITYPVALLISRRGSISTFKAWMTGSVVSLIFMSIGTNQGF